MRVIADHIRATTFLIADGVTPSNEWRGYVLRKIMRRAMRHGKRLGITDPFLHRLVDVLVAEMGTAYPELKSNRETVVSVIKGEEERFDAVLTGGLPRLEEILEKASASKNKTVPGEDAFRLYDSLGMPVDFIEDLASERQLTFDRAGYERAMEAQRERARASSAFEQKKADPFTYTSDAARQTVERTSERFEGYTTTVVTDVPVIALFNESRQQVDKLAAGDSGFVVTERTPFYLEAGGQVSDTGVITTADGDGDAAGGRRATEGRAASTAASVDGVVRIAPGAPRAHHVKVTRGTLTAGATRHVDGRRRAPRCDPPQSHRHAPAARRAAQGARASREAGGLARRARSAAVRLRPPVGDLRERAGCDRTARQRRSAPQHRRGHRGEADERGDRGGRDGVVRREIRRHGARRVHPELQPGAVRRHPLPRDRRHRLVHHRSRGRRRGRRAPHRSADR